MKLIEFKFMFIVLTFFCFIARAQIPQLVNDENLSPQIEGIENLISFKGLLFFTAKEVGFHKNKHIYRTDGTSEGTHVLKKINGGKFTVVNDMLFFSGPDSIYPINVLWVTDGSEIGTKIIKGWDPDYWPGINYPISFDDKLFFSMVTNENGHELWMSNGTTNGTSLVKDINIGEANSYPRNLMIHDGELYFFADDGINGRELWKTNGTEKGTVLVMDINPGINNSDDNIRTGYISYKDFLIFSANDGIHGSELWKTDGTKNGTSMIKDINEGEYGSFPSWFVNFNGYVYFSAVNSSYTIEDSPIFYNTELFRTDGTESGTYLIKDINPGRNGSDAQFLMNCNNHLIFSAESENGNMELWVSDGTNKGTHILKDINSGNMGFWPQEFVAISNNIYFRASSGFSSDLWVTDGTVENTNQVSQVGVRFIEGVDHDIYFNTTNYNQLYKLTVLSNLIIEYEVELYPVPFGDELSMLFNKTHNQQIDIIIYNQIGQKVFSEECSFEDKIIILSNLGFLEEGLYFMELIINKNRVVKKIMKMN